MEQARVFIYGMVQGVGFRQFIKWMARKVSVFGWSQNLPNGSVEAVLQGDRKQILKVIQAIKKGPPIAQVEKVVVRWETPKEEYNEFVVKK